MSAFKYKQNLHTHTVYCDGKNTPEEIILKAIDLGFDTIGFSGHSYTGFDISWHMTQENTQNYIAEVNALKSKYADTINVLCGLELEVFSKHRLSDFDYVIGSSHFLNVDGEIVEFDVDADTVSHIIDEYFHGDGMKYAKSYYSNMAELYKFADFDIVGHFDIITKHAETHNFFDVNSAEYRNVALEALHSLAEKKKIFEVNTGAISRGYRTSPYPAEFILDGMKELGCTLVLTSDCHDCNYLDCFYDDAIELIKSRGFDSIGVMKDGNIEEIGL